MSDPTDYDTEHFDSTLHSDPVDEVLTDLLGAASLAALKAWLESEGLSIVRLPHPMTERQRTR